MLLAARDIVGGIHWVEENEEDGDIAKNSRETEKSSLPEPNSRAKKLGVIGLGAIGVTGGKRCNPSGNGCIRI